MEELETLLIRAKRNDLAACGELVRRFQGMALNYAYAVLGDFHLAEDAVQEAFLETCLNLSRIYSPAAFPAFLRKVVYKHCDRIQRKRHPVVPLDTVSSIQTNAKDPAQTIEDRELKRRVYTAFHALPQQERLVAALFYLGSHTRKDIATFLEVPLETVIYRLRSARNKFKKGLTAMTHDTSDPSADTLGKQALSEINAAAAHPELATHVGLLNTRTSMGQNILQHSLDAAHIAGLLATELGLDVDLAQRAGLLHDIGKTVDSDSGITHIDTGVQLSEKYDEHPVVRHVIATHHDQNHRLSPYCFTVKAADALSVVRHQDANARDLDTWTPPIVNLDALARTLEGITDVHALPIQQEIWVLVRGIEATPEDAPGDAIEEGVRKTLNLDGEILITIESENPA